MRFILPPTPRVLHSYTIIGRGVPTMAATGYEAIARPAVPRLAGEKHNGTVCVRRQRVPAWWGGAPLSGERTGMGDGGAATAPDPL